MLAWTCHPRNRPKPGFRYSWSVGGMQVSFIKRTPRTLAVSVACACYLIYSIWTIAGNCRVEFSVLNVLMLVGVVMGPVFLAYLTERACRKCLLPVHSRTEAYARLMITEFCAFIGVFIGVDYYRLYFEGILTVSNFTLSISPFLGMCVSAFLTTFLPQSWFVEDMKVDKKMFHRKIFPFVLTETPRTLVVGLIILCYMFTAAYNIISSYEKKVALLDIALAIVMIFGPGLTLLFTDRNFRIKPQIKMRYYFNYVYFFLTEFFSIGFLLITSLLLKIYFMAPAEEINLAAIGVVNLTLPFAGMMLAFYGTTYIPSTWHALSKPTNDSKTGNG